MNIYAPIQSEKYNILILETFSDLYSLRPIKSIVSTFKFCPTKSVILVCNEIHYIKVIPSTKKALYKKTHKAKQIFSIYYFSSSNVYAFIEDPENQINNTVFNHFARSN